MKARSDLELAGWGLLLELTLLIFWAISGVWRGSERLIASFFIPGLVFLLAAWRCLRGGQPPVTRRTRMILLSCAALFHATLLLTRYPLSNDLYRYFWDGKLLANGINPYAYPPAAVELSSYRDQYWALIFNREVPTGYPPLAEAVFALAYRLRPDPWLLKGIATLASLGTGALLMRALRAAGSDERRMLLYAWSPLVALEFANSAHLDALALLFMSAALLFTLQRRHAGAAACLALGGLAKLFPVLLLAYWGRQWGKKAWLTFALVFTLPWLPLLAGGTPFKGLGIFAGRGDFNSSLYRVIEEGWFLVLDSAYARLWARATVAAILGLYFLVSFLRNDDRGVGVPGWHAVGALFGLGLLFSPVIHPWYVCWMLAFIAIEGRAAWLVLSVTVIFARQIYLGYEQTGVWEEASWPALAVWGPFYLAELYSRLPFLRLVKERAWGARPAN